MITPVNTAAAAKTWLQNGIETSDVEADYIPTGSRCQRPESGAELSGAIYHLKAILLGAQMKVSTAFR
jgi:hypothetical protein